MKLSVTFGALAALLTGVAQAQTDPNAGSSPYPGCIPSVLTWSSVDFVYNASYQNMTPYGFDNSWGYIDFSTATTGPAGYAVHCMSQSPYGDEFYYGNVVYPCIVMVQGDSASFRYTRSTGLMEFNQTWQCMGFMRSATGTAVIPVPTPGCTEEVYENIDWLPGQVQYTKNVTCPKISFSMTATNLPRQPIGG